MMQAPIPSIYPSAAENGAFVVREDAPVRPESRRYDLAERTAAFAERIVQLTRKLPMDPITRPLISQVVRSGSSVGANYCEADDAVSKKEFRQKIGTCRKEAKETKYWIRIIVAAVPAVRAEARALWQEAKELHLIFCAILRKA
jgi:four helix bundle protein